METDAQRNLSEGVGASVDAVKRPSWWPSFRLTVVGLAITGVWLLVLVAYSASELPELLAMEPNEFGDFLAGACAPLAFFWLVLGFFQQGEELRNSSRALHIQGEELRNSVEQQRQLVATTREQLEFEREQLKHDREELVRLAAPVLELVQSGGTHAAEGARNFRFHLSNHGKTCTAVRLQFSGGYAHEWPLLSEGEVHHFNVTLLEAEARTWNVTVDYLDQRMLRGIQQFLVVKNGRDIVVTKVTNEQRS